MQVIFEFELYKDRQIRFSNHCLFAGEDIFTFTTIYGNFTTCRRLLMDRESAL